MSATRLGRGVWGGELELVEGRVTRSVFAMPALACAVTRGALYGLRGQERGQLRCLCGCMVTGFVFSACVVGRRVQDYRPLPEPARPGALVIKTLSWREHARAGAGIGGGFSLDMLLVRVCPEGRMRKIYSA